MRLSQKTVNLFATSVLLIYAIASISPILWFAHLSLNPIAYMSEYPPRLHLPSLEGYQLVISEGFLKYLGDSVIVCLLTIVIMLAVSCPAAYAMTRYRMRGRESLAFLILSTRMIPPIVVVIPLFFTATALGLFDTYWILPIVYNGFLLAFSVWLLRGTFSAVPVEFEEAATVDGCSRLSAFIKIVLPLSWPGIVATTIFCFVMSWNEFVLASLLCSSNVTTAPVYIATSVSQYRVEWERLMPAGILTISVPIIFSLLIQKYIVKAMSFGYAR